MPSLKEKPMKPIRSLIFAFPVALLAACGGQVADPSFLDAVPSYGALSMDQTAEDAAAPLTAALTADSARAVMGPDDPCHPHLFIRTHEVVARVNRHLMKFLRHVASAIAHRPRVATGTQHVWEHVRNDVIVRFTVTRTGPEQFTWLLELAPAGTTDFKTIFSGEIDRTGATGPHQGTGNMTLDLTALHELVPQEHVVGTLSAGFAVSGHSRKLVVDAAQVAWDVDPAAMPAGMGSAVVAALGAPRNAHYVYFREPGKGGSLKIKDQMVFLCPANPSLKLADGVVVGRWYLTGGSLHGRSDALMSGGQLPDDQPPIAKVVGVTCHQSATEAGMPFESFWLMKAEDASGATLAGWSSAALPVGAVGPDACDPKLNQVGQNTDFPVVPTLANADTDFEFDAIRFTTSIELDVPENQPYPFPGM
jgi:hypothetical protein